MMVKLLMFPMKQMRQYLIHIYAIYAKHFLLACRDVQTTANLEV